MAVTVELSEEVEAALKMQALTRGMTASEYVQEVLDRDLAPLIDRTEPKKPFKTSYGILAKYGPAPTDEEMEENRRDMFRGFGENF